MHNWIQLSAPLAAALYISACGIAAGRVTSNHLATAQGTTDQSYGEAVFRLQNTQMDRLIGAESETSDADGGRGAAMVALEDRVVQSCHALNHAAAVRSIGGQLSMTDKMQVLASLADCKSSALAAKLFLETDRPLSP